MIKRNNDEIIIPNGNTLLKTDDRLVILKEYE